MQYKSWILLGVFAALLIGCSSDDETAPPPDIESMVAQGWTEFETENFSAALAHFEEAISHDAAHVQARTGAGWSTIRLNRAADAQTHFTRVLTDHAPSAPEARDALAGIIVAAVMTDSFATANDHGATFVDTQGDGYVFSHDASVTSRAIRILYALAAFHTEHYAEAEAEVEHLDPAIELDPLAPTYHEELLAAIEALMG